MCGGGRKVRGHGSGSDVGRGGGGASRPCRCSGFGDFGVAMAWFLFFSKDIFFFSSKIGGKKKWLHPPKMLLEALVVPDRVPRPVPLQQLSIPAQTTR